MFRNRTNYFTIDCNDNWYSVAIFTVYLIGLNRCCLTV